MRLITSPLAVQLRPRNQTTVLEAVFCAQHNPEYRRGAPGVLA